MKTYRAHYTSDAQSFANITDPSIDVVKNELGELVIEFKSNTGQAPEVPGYNIEQCYEIGY